MQEAKLNLACEQGSFLVRGALFFERELNFGIAIANDNQSSCIGCHKQVRDRDYVFTLPALVTAARTNARQRQKTEFGY